LQQSFAYILNQRPFRDSSVLLDIFSEDFGRLCCIARPAKKRGKVLKGCLEPFRYLHLQWIGKGDVQTLIEADERGRHTIPASEMMMGLYINELILLFTRQHVAFPELFSAYKYTLHKIAGPMINQQILMRFELYLLACLGYPIGSSENEHYKKDIKQEVNYLFTQENGLQKILDSNKSHHNDITIEGNLLLALNDIKSMNEKHWSQLRRFLDRVLSQLAPRPIHSRKLLNLD